MKRLIATGASLLVAVAAFSFGLMAAASEPPREPMLYKNAYYPFTVETSVKDRPVLETVPKVMKARMTGISEFDFDGEHYIIDGLPKEYVDYSSQYCRMP